MNNLSLYEVVLKTSLKYPNATAIYFENHRITYKSMINEINKLASILYNIGVRPKDIVTVCMPNMSAAVYALYAINKLGAVCYEVHPKTTLKQMEKYLEKTNSKYLLVINIFSSNFISLKENRDLTIITFNPFHHISLIKKLVCESKSPTDKVIKYESLKQDINFSYIHKWENYETSVLLNTGGTTGESKQIELSNEAINNLAECGTEILGINNGIGVYMFAVLPLFHGFGLCMGVHAPLMYGAAVSLMMKFHTKDTIKLINKAKLTILIGVPAIYKALLRNKKFYTKNLKNITVAYVGGDFVSESLIKEFNEVMKKYGSKAKLFEGYGLTETVTVCAVNTYNNNKPNSVGRAVSGCSIKTIDPETNEFNPPSTPGEIVVAGNILMNGYFHDEALTKEIFFTDQNNVKWLKTKDYGYVDSDGYLYFKQRLKRIVKVSGVVICPSEIEQALSTLNEVHEVYATSIQDDIRDHMIVLFVSKNNKITISDVEMSKLINDLIKNNISVYAIPKKIIYLSSLPKTEIGKIDGKKLEKELGDGIYGKI